MKLRTKIIAGAAVLASLTFAAGSLQAQVTNVVSMTATAQQQGGTNDNGTVTTAAAPSKHAVNTKTILGWLATDEHAEGNYGNTNFPSGALLAAVDSDFLVLDKNHNVLVDVSDILSTEDGSNQVVSGKMNDATGLAATSQTTLHVLTFIFDDSAVTGGVGVQFYLAGLMTTKITDTTTNGAGVYTESQSNNMSGGAGDGNFQGNPFVITGSLTASGRATLVLIAR